MGTMVEVRGEGLASFSFTAQETTPFAAVRQAVAEYLEATPRQISFRSLDGESISDSACLASAKASADAVAIRIRVSIRLGPVRYDPFSAVGGHEE